MSKISDIVASLKSRVPTALDAPDEERPVFDDGSARELFSSELNEVVDLAPNDDTVRSSSDVKGRLMWEGELPPELDSPDNGTEDSVSKMGVEALAYYVTFRHGSPWGIFIREEGLNYVVASVFPPSSAADSLLSLTGVFSVYRDK